MLYSKAFDQLIDVNLNRLFEALKIVEDITRFYLINNKSLKKLRALKHNLYPKLEKIRTKVLWARASNKDLGRSPDFDLEAKKEGYFPLQKILKTNFSRAQEAARSLEELFKSQDNNLSKLFKATRFALYDLEKILLDQVSLVFNPQLYVILDIPTLARKHLAAITEACIKGGATMIQLREPKETPAKIWLDDALKVKQVVDSYFGVRFIINDRVDIALATDACGVHLGTDDLPPQLARRILGPSKIIGVTVRNLTQAQRAEKCQVNYLSVGSVFPSLTKTQAPVVGLKTLKEVAKKVRLPVIAIGGINQENIKKVFQAQACGVALVAAVFNNVDFTTKNFEGQIIKNLKILKSLID
ncbi:MAG: thiamine phosphate synthase [candidate division WOR-3 bacterium]|nr:thiamine phosphate synthase [candidate division WOR-3 bacterium]MDW7987767.1 thiamine phosphate synthase [candidate division WOR-3 bacterium]